MTRFLAVLWLVLLALAAPAAAQTFPAHHGSPIVDQADVLRPEQELDLRSKSEALFAQTGRAFGVATVKSLEGRSIEDYGYRLGRTWGLGQKGADDGVILVVAPNDRKIRIETGYGARVFLTDAVSSVIIRNTILPRFRANDYAGGIQAGADEIINQMSLSPEEAQRRAGQAQRQEASREESGAGFLPVIFIAIIFFAIIRTLARRAGGRRYHRREARRSGIDPWVVLWGLEALSHASRGRRGGWSGGGWGGGGWGGGGGGGGGFGGFGGGSFGGGGASGSW